MNVNSYVLFGERKEDWSAGFAANIRQHFTMYPNWGFWIHTDSELNDEGYCPVLKRLHQEGLIKISVVPKNQEPHTQRLKCLMMLWRLLPLWEGTNYVFPRDIDSILTPRQLQCVLSFIQSGKAVHGINDNPAHNIPLMGGMCGFRTESFRSIFRVRSLSDLIRGTFGSDKWAQHGSDQDFMMLHLWGKLKDFSLVHKLDGPNSRSHLKHITDVDISYLSPQVREKGDDFTNYIGAVGTQTDTNGTFTNQQIVDFYNEHGDRDKCSRLTKIENDFGYKIT